MPAFADTNVVVYAFAKDDAKIAIAEGILEKQPTISVQVISEFLNVCRTKLGMDVATRHKLAGELIVGCNVVWVQPAPCTGCPVDRQRNRRAVAVEHAIVRERRRLRSRPSHTGEIQRIGAHIATSMLDSSPRRTLSIEVSDGFV